MLTHTHGYLVRLLFPLAAVAAVTMLLSVLTLLLLLLVVEAEWPTSSWRSWHPARLGWWCDVVRHLASLSCLDHMHVAIEHIPIRMHPPEILFVASIVIVSPARRLCPVSLLNRLQILPGKRAH